MNIIHIIHLNGNNTSRRLQDRLYIHSRCNRTFEQQRLLEGLHWEGLGKVSHLNPVLYSDFYSYKTFHNILDALLAMTLPFVMVIPSDKTS